MNTKTFNINDLNLAKYNPRKTLESKSREYENLKKSLKKYGLVVPIVINSRNNTVIGGHQRLNVIKELGYKEVEAVTVDLGETEEKQLNIALNKIEGRWDYQKLEELLQSMTDKELEFTGFVDEDLGIKKTSAGEIVKKDTIKEGFDIYISFSTMETANEWLEAHGIAERIEREGTSITINMEENYD